MDHSTSTANHYSFAAIYANAAARNAATGFDRLPGGGIVPFDTDDLYKSALQLSNFSIWLLVDDSPITWERIIQSDPTVRTVTADDVQADDDILFVDTTAGNVTETLMLAVNRKRPLTIKNIGASGNTAIIDGAGAETIEGAATYSLVDGDLVTIIPRTSSAWERI